MVYSNVVYCPNVVVGWWSGVWRRRLCVRCEEFCLSNIPHTEHILLTYIDDARSNKNQMMFHWNKRAAVNAVMISDSFVLIYYV